MDRYSIGEQQAIVEAGYTGSLKSQRPSRPRVCLGVHKCYFFEAAVESRQPQSPFVGNVPARERESRQSVHFPAHRRTLVATRLDAATGGM